MAEHVDWQAYVRARLTLEGLTEEREIEVIEEVARQLDDAYREAQGTADDDAEARTRAEAHVTDWGALSRELSVSSVSRKPRLERWSEHRDDRSAASRRMRPGTILRQDLVYGWRTLVGTPIVTTMAVVSLALGIGANTALFSVMHALSFRALPVPHAENLVVLTDPAADGFMTGIENGTRTLLSYHEFDWMRAAARPVLDGIVGFSSQNFETPVSIGNSATGSIASVSLVSGEYFATVGVSAQAGRLFGTEVNQGRLAHPVAVVSHRFWQSRLNADPAAVGGTIRLRQTLFDIVGVTPPGFTGLVVGSAPDIWIPLMMQEVVAPGRDWLTQPPGSARRTMFLQVVGRLKDGTSLTQATDALSAAFRQGLEAEAGQITDAARRADMLNANLEVQSAQYGLSALRGEYQQPLTIMMILVGLLLLLACANIANLLLSRATGRARELTLRVALGAGRARLVRQLLTESVMLAGAGAIGGLVVAYWVSHLLLTLVSGGQGMVSLDIQLGGPVLLFAVALTMVTGILCGLVPALRATRVDLNGVLRGTAQNIAGANGRQGWPVGKILTAAQVAISLVLLITAGLFVRSLQRLGDVPVGYDTERLVTFRLAPMSDGLTRDGLRPLFEDLLAGIRALPQVDDVTLSYLGLFSGGDIGSAITVAGRAPGPDADMDSRFDMVGPRYFSTLGVPVVLGRDVEMRDSAGVQGCWLNQTAARHFFADQDPLGQRITVHFSLGDSDYEVRGVVADARTTSIRRDAERRIYLPYFGSVVAPTSAHVEIRAKGDLGQVTPGVRRLVRAADSRLTPVSFSTVAESIGDGLVRDRLTARLSAAFSALALILASIGVFGVLSYTVGRRTGEIGVRLALGARRAGIVRLVIGEAALVTLIGVAVGLGAAFVVAGSLESLLFGLSPRDPLTFAGATSILFLIAVLAAAVPAWRASRTDPLVALRME